MTVAKLAEEINVTPEILFEFFEKIQKPIPHELEFELSEELLSSAFNGKSGLDSYFSDPSVHFSYQETDKKEILFRPAHCQFQIPDIRIQIQF